MNFEGFDFGAEVEQKYEYSSEEQRGKLKAKFKRVFEEPIEGLPPNNGKEAVFQMSVSNGEEEVSLDNFLPPGWRIAERQVLQEYGKEVVADSAARKIFVPRYALLKEGDIEVKTENSVVYQAEAKDGEMVEIHDFWRLKGAILVLLHEIGHAWNSLTLERTVKEIVETHDPIDAIIASKIKDPNKLPDRSVPAYTDMILQEERDAWAYAMRVQKELAQEGFELEDMTNEEKISLAQFALDKYGDSDPRMMEAKKELVRFQAIQRAEK